MKKIYELQKDAVSILPKSHEKDVIPTKECLKDVIDEMLPNGDEKIIRELDFFDDTVRMPLSDCLLTGRGFAMEEDSLRSAIRMLLALEESPEDGGRSISRCEISYLAEFEGAACRMYAHFGIGPGPMFTGMEARFILTHEDGCVEKLDDAETGWRDVPGFAEIENFRNSSKRTSQFCSMLEDWAGYPLPFLDEGLFMEMCDEAVPVIRLAESVGDSCRIRNLAFMEDAGCKKLLESHAAATFEDQGLTGTVVYFSDGAYKICQAVLPAQERGGLLIVPPEEGRIRPVAEAKSLKEAADAVRPIFDGEFDPSVNAVMPLSENAYAEFIRTDGGYRMTGMIRDGMEPSDAEMENVDSARDLYKKYIKFEQA